MQPAPVPASRPQPASQPNLAPQAVVPPAATQPPARQPSVPSSALRIPLPQLALLTPPVTANATTAAPTPSTTGVMPTRGDIDSFLNPRLVEADEFTPTDEGRMFTILHAVDGAMRPLGGGASVVSADQLRRLRASVRDHLAGELDDVSLTMANRMALGRLARRLVDAVLEGNYAGVLGGDSTDALRELLAKQRKPDSVALRDWGIGDLTDDGAEAVPPSLRHQKTMVDRVSALVPEGLLAAAHFVERLSLRQGQSITLAQARRIAGARIGAQALQAGLAGKPLLFDLDRYARLKERQDALAQGHLDAVRALQPALSKLASEGIVGPLTYLSSAPRGMAAWEPIMRGLSATRDVQALTALIGATAPVATSPVAADRPLPLVAALQPAFQQTLDRRTGRVVLFKAKGAPVLELSIPPLPDGADAQRALRQDEDLARLDAFIAVVFADLVPPRTDFLPAKAALEERRFRVGDILVASSDDDGQWRIDPDGLALVRQIFGPIGFAKPTTVALKDWAITYEGELAQWAKDTEADASAGRLRIFLQMEDDEVMHKVGATLSRQHPDELVWVQVAPGGAHRVLRGQSLLDNATAESSVRLVVSGHGRTSARTRERVLSGRDPEALAAEIKKVLNDLTPPDRRLPPLDRIDLLSCALETPAVQHSFGRAFSRAVRSVGRPGMETTVFGQTVIVDLYSRRLVLNTQEHLNASVRAGAARTTWAFRSDPVTGITSVRDKFPRGNEGRDVGSHRCLILGDGPPRRSSRRSLMLGRSQLMDRATLLDRFREVVTRHRPPGGQLLPRIDDTPSGRVALSFVNLDGGALHSREIEPGADAQVAREGIAAIRAGLAEVDDLLDRWDQSAGEVDLLNIGLLALMVASLADGTAQGDRYQGELWRLTLGAGQGLFQAASDAASLASLVMKSLASADDQAFATIAARTAFLSRTLAAASRLAQAGTFALDLKELIDVVRQGGSRRAVKQAAVNVALDVSSLCLIAIAKAAEIAGKVDLALVAEGLSVPLAGLSIGAAALQRAVQTEEGRLNRNLDFLRRINSSYDDPLKSVALDAMHPGKQVLLPNGWGPIKRINLVTGEVSFADATVGATVLHRYQLYRQFGSARVHSSWITNDGSDQGRYSTHGLDLDLWTLLHRSGRETTPRVRLPAPLLDPSVPLGLMTAPNVKIRFDRYSASRAGGDFSLLGDPLLARMQNNSDLFFVGDFVSSTSFAKSADRWRIAAKPSPLEIVLDDKSRVLALPSASDADTRTFTFEDDRGLAKRRWRPMSQDKVHVRLVGGGGRYTLAIPPDGTVRNPVRILPSDKAREIWTVMLKGGLLHGGRSLEFTDGGVDGFRFAGQEFQFEALNGAIIQLADPLVPGVRVVLDLERRQGVLVLTLPTWSADLRPHEELRRTLLLLATPEQAREAELFQTLASSPDAEPDASAEPADIARLVQLACVTEEGEAMAGLLDPVTGATMLLGQRHLMLLEYDGAKQALPWARYELKGGEVALNTAQRPVVRYDGGHFFEPITFVYLMEERRFGRERPVLTRAGERMLLNWMAGHPGWSREDLQRFLTKELAAGLELAGPEGGERLEILEVDFQADAARPRRPKSGTTQLALWERLDRLERHAPANQLISTKEDPDLAHALVLEGLAGFRVHDHPALGEARIPAGDVALAKDVLMLRRAQETGGFGEGTDEALQTAPLSLARRTRLTLLAHELQDLLDQHQAAGGRSDWVRLGATPDESEKLVHQLRDEGLDIRIDALSDDAGERATDRAGPGDFYDVRSATMQLFLHDLRATLDLDAAAERRRRGLSPVDPSGTVLQRDLARLARRHALQAQADAVVTDIDPALLERVQRARLSFWVDARNGAPTPAPRLGPAEPAAQPAESAESAESAADESARNNSSAADPSPREGLGRVWTNPQGVWETEAATLRLWQDEADTQSLLMDEWYALHATAGSAIEAQLRAPAIEALRDRLLDTIEEARGTGRSVAVLHADPALNRALLQALLRVLPKAVGIRQADATAGVPGDVFLFHDRKGAGHYARMRRPDPGLTHLTPDLDHGGEDPYWDYLGRAEDLGPDLRPPLLADPAPPIARAADFLAWRRADPAPQVGGVYAYDNPVSEQLELFRLLRLSPTQTRSGAPYGYFPIDGGSNADWRYLGNTESLSADELGELAVNASPLRPLAFTLGLLSLWADQLAPESRGEGYRRLRIEDDLISVEATSRSRFQIVDQDTLRIELDDGETRPFRPADDAELTLFRQRFVLGQQRAPRWMLIQTNGRPVDLDGVAALGMPEVVILDEFDNTVPRPLRIDLDDVDSDKDELFYEGADLLIHRPDNGPLIRIRNALRPASTLLLDDEWVPAVQVTSKAGTRELVWPERDRSLRLPMLTLYGSQLEAWREGADLGLGDGPGWSRIQVLDVFSTAESDAKATGVSEALLRRRSAGGEWQVMRMSAPLINAIGSTLHRVREDGGEPPQGRSAATVSRWNLKDDDTMTPTDGDAPLVPWRLERAKLVELMAGMPPDGQGLAPGWTSSASRPAGPGATLTLPQQAATQAAGAAA